MAVSPMCHLTYEEARRILDACLAEARRQGVPISVAVIDGGRELLAFARQDGCPLISGEVAISKAFTARSTDRPSGELGPLTTPDGIFWGLQHGLTRPMTTFGGGYPILERGCVIGAIGVGGGTIEEDEQIAQAGLTVMANEASK